jgi:hypothetical protein
MDDMDDEQVAAWTGLVGVAEKDHVIAKGSASVIPAEFWAGTAKACSQSRDLLAMLRDLVDKCLSGLAAVGTLFDIGGDVRDVLACRGQINELGHLTFGGASVEALAGESTNLV